MLDAVADEADVVAHVQGGVPAGAIFGGQGFLGNLLSARVFGPGVGADFARLDEVRAVLDRADIDIGDEVKRHVDGVVTAILDITDFCK